MRMALTYIATMILGAVASCCTAVFCVRALSEPSISINWIVPYVFLFVCGCVVYILSMWGLILTIQAVNKNVKKNSR